MNPLPYRTRYLFADGERSISRLEDISNDLLLGTTLDGEHHFSLTEDDRTAHMYLCGITGSGKTRFLENLILQDIIAAQPLCLIDPTGALYRAVLDFIAFATEHAVELGHNEADLLAPLFFLDFDDPANPVCINPLEPNPYETTEEQVDDLLKVSERLFGSLDEMRRLRNVLQSSMSLTVELNRLAEQSPDVQQTPLLRNQTFPLNLDFIADFLLMPNTEKQALIDLLPDSRETKFIKQYWTVFFPKFSESQQAERIESSLNILQYFVSDALVRRFFDAHRSTIHVARLMKNRQSLFCNIPLGKNLKGGQLIGAYIATKYQRTAYRRPQEERYPYYLYIDEFHEFADIDFAKAAVTLRQYGLFMINAHQSQSQPPFHTEEGRSILETIKGNSRIRVLFRLTREDAETMSKEVFEMTQSRYHFSYHEESLALNSGKTTSTVVSYQKTVGSSMTWSRQDSIAIAETDTYGIAKTEGVNLGETITEGFGDTISEGISHTISDTTGETLTESRSKAHGITVLMGENWSHMVNEKTGFSFTQTDKESLALQRGLSESHTDTTQDGTTQTQGNNYQVTDGHGNSLTRNQSQMMHHYQSGIDYSEGGSVGTMNNHAESQGRQFSTAISNLRSTADGISRSQGQTTTSGHDVARGTSHGRDVSNTRGGQYQTSISDTETVSEARARMQSHSDARGTTSGLSKSYEESLAQSFQELLQFSKNYSQALQQTVSQTDGLSFSDQQSTTTGESFSEARSQSTTESLAEKKIYLSLEGERELSINDLQKLPRQQCIVTKDALSPIWLQCFFVPDGFYAYRLRNYPRYILEQQRKRLIPDLEITSPAVTEAVLTDIPGSDVENSPWNL